MAFELLEPPGFVDIPDALLRAGSPATGFAFSALKDNAAFGSVVPEVFYGTYHDGQTVAVPVSPVDGYQYLRSELVYVWEVENTLNNQSGAPSSANPLLWMEWYVEPNTGLVHSTEIYGTNSLSSWTQSHDGTLGVWTFGIRGRGVRSLAAPPSYTDLPAADFASDTAATETVLKQLSHNGKLSSVQCEIIAVNPSNAPAWQPSHFYAAGSLVQPTGLQASGFWFIAANSGTSATIEPTWPGKWHDSAPVDDGSIVWNVAGAGFHNGQQIPYPASPIDGYQYSGADKVIPFISFISTQSMPIQKSNGVVFTSGNVIGEMRKSVVAVQPNNPGQGGSGGGPPGAPPIGNPVRTIWKGTLQNWTPQIAPPPAPVLSTVVSGANAARTYYVKITYTSAAGETTASAESSIVVPANSVMVVTSPAASGAATGYNVYVGTASGAEQLQGLSPTPLGTNWQEFDSGLDPGNALPTANTTGFVPAAAEGLISPMLAPGTPATQLGIVQTSITYINGTFPDGTVMVWCLCFRNVPAMAAPGGANFTDMATDWFTSGYPLRSDYMQDVNENAKFSILRPEIFLNVGVDPGTAVPVPVSPVDGYHYQRGELTYMWYFTYTGISPGHLRDFSTFVDPITGIVNTVNDYYRNAGSTLATAIYGPGGLTTYRNMGGSGRGKQSVNVIVVAHRQHETELQTPINVTTGGQQPAPPGPYNLIPNGDFQIWSIPSTSATNAFGVADDWGVLQNAGQTAFFQWPGIGNSLFAQAISAKPAGNSLAQRQQVPPPGGDNIASIGSMIIPVWPGGTYKYHFLASAMAQFSNDYISFGFYARIHLLAADSNGEPDTSQDTSFELLGTNLTVQPGTTSANNPGGGVLVSPPAFDVFDFTFTIPLNGATSAATSVGQSILSQALLYNPAYLYVEFMLWDVVSSGTQHQRQIFLDNVILQDLTTGSTNLVQQGSIPSGADNSQFSFVSAPTTIGFYWGAFNLFYPNGTAIPIAAQGSAGAPAKVFASLTASTTYYFACRYNIATAAFEFFMQTTRFTSQFQIQTLNADGFVAVFLNWSIATPGSGSGGGGGSTGGSGCFTGETLVKTVKGFIKFEDLGKVVVIENATGVHVADVVVHEDCDEDVVAIGSGRVNLVHPLKWCGGWISSGKLFAGAKKSRYKGRLYNLHVRSDREEDKHYVIEGGWCAHNLKIF